MEERAKANGLRTPERVADARARDAWLARTVDEEVRAPLVRAVLWMEHLLGDRSDPDDPAAGRHRGHDALERELLSALTRIEDLLSLVRPEEGQDSDGVWLRSILVRDLIGAALRDLEPEIERKGMRVDLRVDPRDLHLVADSNWALHAVEALVRAGVRSTSTGEILSISATAPEMNRPGTEADRAWVTVTLSAPGFEAPNVPQTDETDGGTPWGWDEAPTGAVPLALAAAGRYASLMEGLLDLAPADRGKGVRMRLRLPADLEPERRPGWIP